MSKSKFYLLAVISFLALASSFFYLESLEKEHKTPIIITKTDVLKKIINVDGMTCVGCEVTVEKAVKSIEGVIKVKASHSDKNVIIEYDKSTTNLDKIKEAIVKKGYQLK